MDHVFKVTVSVEVRDGIASDAYPWKELSDALAEKLFNASSRALVETFCDLDAKEMCEGKADYGAIGNMKSWQVKVDRE